MALTGGLSKTHVNVHDPFHKSHLLLGADTKCHKPTGHLIPFPATNGIITIIRTELCWKKPLTMMMTKNIIPGVNKQQAQRTQEGFVETCWTDVGVDAGILVTDYLQNFNVSLKPEGSPTANQTEMALSVERMDRRLPAKETA